MQTSDCRGQLWGTVLALLLFSLSTNLPLSRAVAFAAGDRLGDPLPTGATQRLGTLRLQYPSGLGALCYLPDGRGCLAAGSRLEIWDLARGERQAEHEIGIASLRSLSLRGDGKALLVGAGDGKLYEWGVETGTVLRSWDTREAGLSAAHYSPDAARALVTLQKPPRLTEWELATGQRRLEIAGKMHYFHEAIYAPDGKTAFVNGGAGSGAILAHYDLASGELLKELLKDYYAHDRSLVLSPDGERLLLGSRHKATEWQLNGYQLLKEFSGHHGHAVTSVAYCKDPDELLTGSRDGSIRRWNRQQAKVLLRWWPHNGHVTHLAVSPDGQWALSYGAGMVADCSLATGEPRVQWQRHGGPVQTAAFLPGGRHVLSGATDDTLRLWDSQSGATVRVLQGAKLGAYAVAVSPEGTKAAAGCKDGVLREFRLADGVLLRELSAHRGYVRSVTYAPDGARLFSSADDGSICLWTSEADEPVARLEGHRGGVLSLSLSPDGRRLLSGGRDGTVRLWDAATAKPVRTLEGHYGWVEAVAFLGNGERAVSAGRDERILHWEVGTGKLLGEIGAEGPYAALAPSPDGRRVYAGRENGAVLCWDLETAQKTGALTGHQGAIAGLALTADGKQLVSASVDTTLLVWNTAGD